MNHELILLIWASIASLMVLYFLLKRIKAISDGITGIINDTLKKKDKETGELKWSRTSLTMWSAWLSAEIAFFYDMCQNGFNMMSFSLMCGIALGAKVTDAITKHIDPTIVAPKTNGNENKVSE